VVGGWGGGGDGLEGWKGYEDSMKVRQYMTRDLLFSEYRQGRLEIPVNVNKGRATHFDSRPCKLTAWKTQTEMDE
jgi:hypothetical protein